MAANDPLKQAERLGASVPHPVMFIYPVTQDNNQDSTPVPEIAIFRARSDSTLSEVIGYGDFTFSGARLFIRVRRGLSSTTILDKSSGSFITLGASQTITPFQLLVDDLITVEITKPGNQALTPFSLLIAITG